jgi:serine phosphatase RsbU (regulator of sigma subunit)
MLEAVFAIMNRVKLMSNDINDIHVSNNAQRLFHRCNTLTNNLRLSLLFILYLFFIGPVSAQQLSVEQVAGDFNEYFDLVNNDSSENVDVEKRMKLFAPIADEINYLLKQDADSLNIGERDSLIEMVSIVANSYYQEMGDIQNALKYSLLAQDLIIPETKKDLEINVLSDLGNFYENSGKLEKSLDYYLRSYDLSVALGDSSVQGRSEAIYFLTQIGLSNSLIGNNEAAREYYDKAMDMAINLDEKTRSIKSMQFRVSHVAYESIRHEKSLKDPDLQRIEELFEFAKGGAYQLLNDSADIWWGKSWTCRLMVHYYLGTNADSTYHYLDLGEYYSEMNAMQPSLYIFRGLRIEALFNDKKYEQVISKGKQYIKDSDESGFSKGLPEVYYYIYKSYTSSGNDSKAIQWLEEYQVVKDSLDLLSDKLNAAVAIMEYNIAKQSLLDSISLDEERKFQALTLSKEKAEKKSLVLENEHQKRQSIFLYLIIGVSLIGGGFVFNRYRVTQKQKSTIEEQKKIVDEKNKEITDSINYAERIQRSFLATNDLLHANLGEHFVYFNPKEAVSGDFYWAGELANGNFAISCADSTGHGVPGAIMSILNISSIEKAVETKLTKPADIFNKTRALIIQRLAKDGSPEGGKDGMDASLIIIDKDKSLLKYVAANNPIWIIRAGELIDIKPEKMPVGKHDHDSVPFEGGELQLEKGDVVYTLTDGFQDQFGGEKGKKFKIKPMKRMLVELAEKPMFEQRDKIAEIFQEWKGDQEQVDDVCIMGVRV